MRLRLTVLTTTTGSTETDGFRGVLPIVDEINRAPREKPTLKLELVIPSSIGRVATQRWQIFIWPIRLSQGNRLHLRTMSTRWVRRVDKTVFGIVVLMNILDRLSR